MPSRFARPNSPDAVRAASTLELFYDLVFVFAITQITKHLLEHLTWAGAGESALMLLVVWWSWNFTTWVTNELDTEATAVRLVVIGVMLASLLMAVAIPDVYGGNGAGLFIGAYLVSQVGRHTFLTFGSGRSGTVERSRAGHILIWFAGSGVFWVAGVLVDEGPRRTGLWLVALAIDYAGPLALFRVPGLPMVSGRDWEVQSSHFTERYGLFMIIALGESVVVTGDSVRGGEVTLGSGTAFVLAFATTAALWWLYFSAAASAAEHQLGQAVNRTTAARDAYTYLHVVLVAGVVLSAAGDELMIAHPGDALETAELLALVAGPALYLLAHAVFRLRLAGSLSWSRVAGAGACLVIGLLAREATALVVGGLLLAVLVLVILADRLRERSPVPAG